METFAVLIEKNAFCLLKFDANRALGEIINIRAKLYIPSTLNIDLRLWHTHLIVCAVKR